MIFSGLDMCENYIIISLLLMVCIHSNLAKPLELVWESAKEGKYISNNK